MATDAGKDKIIRGVYYDPEDGFGPINDIY